MMDDPLVILTEYATKLPKWRCVEKRTPEGAYQAVWFDDPDNLTKCGGDPRRWYSEEMSERVLRAERTLDEVAYLIGTLIKWADDEEGKRRKEAGIPDEKEEDKKKQGQEKEKGKGKGEGDEGDKTLGTPPAKSMFTLWDRYMKIGWPTGELTGVLHRLLTQRHREFPSNGVTYPISSLEDIFNAIALSTVRTASNSAYVYAGVRDTVVLPKGCNEEGVGLMGWSVDTRRRIVTELSGNHKQKYAYVSKERRDRAKFLGRTTLADMTSSAKMCTALAALADIREMGALVNLYAWTGRQYERIWRLSPYAANYGPASRGILGTVRDVIPQPKTRPTEEVGHAESVHRGPAQMKVAIQLFREAMAKKVASWARLFLACMVMAGETAGAGAGEDSKRAWSRSIVRMEFARVGVPEEPEISITEPTSWDTAAYARRWGPRYGRATQPRMWFLGANECFGNKSMPMPVIASDMPRLEDRKFVLGEPGDTWYRGWEHIYTRCAKVGDHIFKSVLEALAYVTAHPLDWPPPLGSEPGGHDNHLDMTHSCWTRLAVIHAPLTGIQTPTVPSSSSIASTASPTTSPPPPPRPFTLRLPHIRPDGPRVSPRNWVSRSGRMTWRFLMSVGMDISIGYVGDTCSYVPRPVSSSSGSSGSSGNGNHSSTGPMTVASTASSAATEMVWPKNAPLDIEEIASNTNILPPCIQCRSLSAIRGGLPRRAMFPRQEDHLKDTTRPETTRFFLQVGMPIPAVQAVMNKLSPGFKINSLLATPEGADDTHGPGDVIPTLKRASSGAAKSCIRGCRRMIEDSAMGKPVKAQQFTGCPVSAALLDGCRTSRAALEHVYGAGQVMLAERELLFIDTMGGRSAVSDEMVVEGVGKACGSLGGIRWPVKYPTQWTRHKFKLGTGGGGGGGGGSGDGKK